MGEEYEVPSPHEHELEEAVEKKRHGLTQKIALMTAVLATIGALSREDHGNYFEHLCNHYGQVRRFLPRLLREIHFEGNRAGQSVLEALEFLKRLEDSPQVAHSGCTARGSEPRLAPVTWL